MEYQIESRTLAEQATAVMRASLPVARVGEWLQHTYRDVAGYLDRAGVAITGPPIARYTIHDDVMDLEAGFPVGQPTVAEGGVVPSSLPAGSAAVTTHYGRYEDLAAAHDAVMRWLRDNGHQPRGSHWEVYYTDPVQEPDPTRWRTDVVVPFAAG
ncbi:MAG TPA: GyrI-like domain-containing protein [Micromonosporaceae bacterium]